MEEPSKLERIYREYKNLMFYVANQILQNEGDAEDAVHSAFVKLAEVVEKISDPVCPKTQGLVVVIVKRLAINQYNARKRRSGLPLEEALAGVLMEPVEERETARRRRRMGGLKQAAAVALVCLGVALGGISTAHALHIPIIQTMVSIVQNFTEYQFSASTSAPEAPLGAFSLTWLPEGLEEVSCQESPTQYVVEWRGEGEFLVLEQQRITPDTVSVYGAGDLGARVTRFMLRGAEAVGREKGENTSVFWTDSCFFYLLSSSLPLEDLRQIAEGMAF